MDGKRSESVSGETLEMLVCIKRYSRAVNRSRGPITYLSMDFTEISLNGVNGGQSAFLNFLRFFLDCGSVHVVGIVTPVAIVHVLALSG